MGMRLGQGLRLRLRVGQGLRLRLREGQGLRLRLRLGLRLRLRVDQGLRLRLRVGQGQGPGGQGGDRIRVISTSYGRSGQNNAVLASEFGIGLVVSPSNAVGLE